MSNLYPLRRMAAAVVMSTFAAASLAAPEVWFFNESSTGQDVTFVSPTSVDPNADLYEFELRITRAEAEVRFGFLEFPVDITDSLPPESTLITGAVPGPAPVELTNSMFIFPEPPEPAGFEATIITRLDANGFGIIEVTDLFLGTVTIDIGIGAPQSVQLIGLTVEGSISVEAINLTLLGDMNCDGVINTGDIDPFVLALLDPATYAVQFPDCDLLNADVNGDGEVNTGDIDPFVALLLGP